MKKERRPLTKPRRHEDHEGRKELSNNNFVRSVPLRLCEKDFCGKEMKGAMSNKLINSQRNTKSGVHLFHFGRGTGTYVMCEFGFLDIEQFIKMNGAVVFETFGYAYLDLWNK